MASAGPKQSDPPAVSGECALPHGVGEGEVAAQHRLDCLEVWGGSAEIESSIRVTGMDAWVWSHPAGAETGGDIYLVSMCACAEVSRFLVADVSGHGADASDVALHLRRLMRRHINKPDQTRLAVAINTDFDGMAQHGKFATALLATFFPPTRHLILCNAGHPRPLHYRSATGQWQPLDPAADADGRVTRNLPLGIRSEAAYEQFAVQLEPEDRVLIYTDGLTETRGRDGHMLGESGLLNFVSGLERNDTADPLSDLHRKMVDFADAAPSRDDLTMLMLRANGEKPPPQSLAQKLRVTAKMLGLMLGR